MIRTDIRKKVSRPSEIAEKIQLMGYKLSSWEQERCKEQIQDVLQFLDPVKKKLVAAIHEVLPEDRPRLYVGKSYLIEKRREELTQKRRALGALLTKMTVAEVEEWIAAQQK